MHIYDFVTIRVGGLCFKGINILLMIGAITSSRVAEVKNTKKPNAVKISILEE